MITVSDSDGSETVSQIDYELSGLPAGAMLDPGSTGATISNGTLSFSGDETAFNALKIIFPADYSTQGDPDMTGTIRVQTNEGGDQTDSFTLAITGELDLELTVTPTDAARPGPRSPSLSTSRPPSRISNLRSRKHSIRL